TQVPAENGALTAGVDEITRDVRAVGRLNANVPVAELGYALDRCPGAFDHFGPGVPGAVEHHRIERRTLDVERDGRPDGDPLVEAEAARLRVVAHRELRSVLRHLRDATQGRPQPELFDQRHVPWEKRFADVEPREGRSFQDNDPEPEPGH